jgi:hypothetical protein
MRGLATEIIMKEAAKFLDERQRSGRPLPIDRLERISLGEIPPRVLHMQAENAVNLSSCAHQNKKKKEKN